MLRPGVGSALMCGRVVAASPREVLAARLSVDEVVGDELPARWNVAPGSLVYAVAGTRSGHRRLGPLWWGLVPSWATEPRGVANARTESLLEKPTFEGAVAGRRCLVPVDGFYEWEAAPDGKQPWFLAPADEGPMAIAAVWDRWVGDHRLRAAQAAAGSAPHVSCALVTTPANDDVSPLHDRMPAILAPELWDEWLDPDNHDVERLHRLLRPAPPGGLSSRPVSRRVNRVANEGPELLSDPEPPAVLSLFSNDSS